MEESKKILEIEVPQGYEIDKENSTFEKITFKKVEERLTYEKIREKLFKNKQSYYICNGKPKSFNPPVNHIPYAADHAPTSQQLERLLAINKLMSIAYYLNNGWKPDWNNIEQEKLYIYYSSASKTIEIEYNRVCNSGEVYFKSKELAKQAIEILGEETIKLALGVI